MNKAKVIFMLSIILIAAVSLTTPISIVRAANEPIWTDTAYSYYGNNVTSPTLPTGNVYRIEVAEHFWYDRPANLSADAMYYTTDPSDDWNWGNHFACPDGHSFLQMNGQDVNWGNFSNGDTSHAYAINYTGQGIPLTFQIVDWMDLNRTNDECHIPISIYLLSEAPTPTPTPTPTATPTPTSTPTPTAAPTQTPTSTETPAPTETENVPNDTPTATPIQGFSADMALYIAIPLIIIIAIIIALLYKRSR